jgi:hypothetical protein
VKTCSGKLQALLAADGVSALLLLAALLPLCTLTAPSGKQFEPQVAPIPIAQAVATKYV